MVHILKCQSCKSYGLTEVCTCGSKRVRIEPAKYSPEDKYADYRRKAKEIEEGNLDENSDEEYEEDLEDEGEN